jgi:signal transduction histidine kinase
MNTAEIFREASLLSGSESEISLAEAVQISLQDNTPSRRLEARYVTPAGEERILDVTATAVWAPNGEVLGAACLINDQTEMAQIRRQQELRGDMSAEMALELRNSLATISGYAQQLAANHDPELARQLAADIAAESAHLGRTIGGFLAGAKAAKAASQA